MCTTHACAIDTLSWPGPFAQSQPYWQAYILGRVWTCTCAACCSYIAIYVKYAFLSLVCALEIEATNAKCRIVVHGTWKMLRLWEFKLT